MGFRRDDNNGTHFSTPRRWASGSRLSPGFRRECGVYVTGRTVNSTRVKSALMLRAGQPRRIAAAALRRHIADDRAAAPVGRRRKPGGGVLAQEREVGGAQPLRPVRNGNVEGGDRGLVAGRIGGLKGKAVAARGVAVLLILDAVVVDVGLCKRGGRRAVDEQHAVRRPGEHAVPQLRRLIAESDGAQRVPRDRRRAADRRRQGGVVTDHRRRRVDDRDRVGMRFGVVAGRVGYLKGEAVARRNVAVLAILDQAVIDIALAEAGCCRPVEQKSAVDRSRQHGVGHLVGAAEIIVRIQKAVQDRRRAADRHRQRALRLDRRCYIERIVGRSCAIGMNLNVISFSRGNPETNLLGSSRSEVRRIKKDLIAVVCIQVQVC